MRCPHCKNKLLQKSGDSTRLRTEGPIVFTKAECRSKCYWCKADVTIPVTLQDVPVEAERFFLRK